MPPADRQPVNQARMQLQAARIELTDAVFAEEQASLNLEQARRQASGEALAPYEQALVDARNRVATARLNLAYARAAVHGAIGSWLGPGGGKAEVDADIARLEASTPIVLFPVRLETRFELGGEAPSLQVRIYPDEIFLNTHEYALTPEEEAAGIAYWNGLSPGAPELQERWRDLVTRFDAPRAAYIVRALRPGQPAAASGCVPYPYYIPGGGELTLPELPRAADVWSRAGEAVLPDRWVVIAYRRGKAPRYVTGLPIPEPLSLTANPNVAPEDVLDLGDDFRIDKDIAWTVDFEAAVDAGMAVRVPLEPDEVTPVTGGFDQLLVLGVKSSLGPLETSALIENLLDAHHYTRGLALVPQGTPTNNTSGQATPFPPRDPHGERSFRIERQPPPPDLGQSHQVPPVAPDDPLLRPADFDRLAEALGVPNSVFQNVEGAFALEQYRAEAMNQAIWPASLGYFLDQMLRPRFFLSPPLFTRSDIRDASGYFRRWVRGRGPVPAFRVGAVPYGVLPIVSLGRWIPRSFDIDNPEPDEALESRMVRVLRRLREIWRQGQRPRAVRPDGVHPLDPLAELMSEDASSLSVRLREHTGGPTNWNLGGIMGAVMAGVFNALGLSARAIMAKVGLPNLNPRILNMTFKDRSVPFEGAFAEAAGGPTAASYIRALASASLADLWDDKVYGSGQKTLLYMLLRHALLLETIRVARELREDLFNAGPVPDREPESWPASNRAYRTARAFLATAPDESSSLFEQARASMAAGQFHEYLPALERLAGTPPEELARLLSETLDVSSHRLDAWVTAFATHRLSSLRRAQLTTCFKPVGDYLGGYGWVEEIRPGAAARPNDGFIHAPSQAHASAAAILRCGFAAYRRQAQNKYAIDLSSERARRARRLIEEVREGQTLGAALGYRFERGLHENHQVPGIDAFIYYFRHLFPQVANQSGLDPYEKVETVAARNVVDGLKLVRGVGTLDFAQDPRLPRPGTAAYLAVRAELDRLEELFDAVSDLVNAEAIYQVATGDIASAQANVDFLPEGRNAPEPELVRTERGGLGVTHRVMLLLPPVVTGQGDAAVEAPPPLPAGWPALGSTGFPRSRAEPFLDAWVGHRLGRADRVQATVRYKDAGGTSRSYTVTLADLQMRPLDLLAIAQDETLPSVDQELERRILQAPAPAGAKTEVRIDFAVEAAGFASFPQVMELARAAAVFLGAARPLAAADLVTPLEAAEVDPAAALAAARQLKSAADAAYDALLEAHDAFSDAEDAASQRAAAVGAARFAAGTFPPPPLADADDEAAQMEVASRAAAAELERRIDLANRVYARPPTSDTDPGVTAAALNQKATDILKAVFGQSFFALPAIGLLGPANQNELQLSLQARATLLGTDEPSLQDSAPVRFLQQVALVREGARRWRGVTVYNRALGRAADRLAVMQLPHVPGEAWAGRAVPPGPGRISLLAFTPPEFPALSPALNLRGLLIDEWVEAIPRGTQETAVAFHYDYPNAEAPQAILVAVPARTDPTWHFDDLLAAVKETFELTDVRSINPETLGLGSVLPSPSLAFAPGGHAVSTDFSNNRVKDRAVRARPPAGNVGGGP